MNMVAAAPVPDMRALFGAAQSSPSPPEPASPESPADDLRLQLAVRGWVAPLLLIDRSIASQQAQQIIETLSREVETAVETRPGQWFLTNAARKLELARRSRDELYAAAAAHVAPDGGDDPVRSAMLIALDDAPPDLDALDTPVLAALATACDWFPADWPLPTGARRAADALALRALDADLALMTRLPLVGVAHRRSLAQLQDFCSRPRSTSLSVCYIHGGGGAGKTTLLAFLQTDLQHAVPPAAVARIDFDEPAIDAAHMVTLNLALFEQLARTSDAVGARVSAMLPVLRQTAILQRSAAPRTNVPAPRKGGAMLSEDSVVSQSISDEGSILYGMLSQETGCGPVVIILDTAELVLAHSDRIASCLIAWFDFLRQEAGAGSADLRVVLAGRDPPPVDGDPDAFAVRNLLSRLHDAGTTVSPLIALPDLDPVEAAELLRNCGLVDDATIASAAAAVPGNPLLLSITANALMSGGDEKLVETVRAAHLASQIDAASARNYLMRRIVAHVSDPQARPYVLPALYSPLLTRDLLEEAIIPAVDRMARPRETPLATDDRASRHAARRMANRVFGALGATNWLMRPSLDRGVIAFNRDIRSFALKLLAATPESAAIERDLRQSAQIMHLKRRSPTDKALAVYQAAMLGDRYTLPRDPTEFGVILRGVLDEVPPRLREWLVQEPAQQSRRAAKPPLDEAPSARPPVPDSLWRLYIEGDGTRRGEGSQLVKDDRAREALDLYRSRPTRPPGMPPTFVIRALADLGEWRTPEVDISATIEADIHLWQFGGQPSQQDLSRFYWLTRLALFRSPTLAPLHLHMLRVVADIATGSGLAALPGLAAIATASGDESGIRIRLRTRTRGSIDEGRLYLVDPSYQQKKPLALRIGQIAVTQANWQKRLAREGDMIDASHFSSVQSRIGALHGRPIAEVNQLFDGLRETVDVRLGKRTLDAEILILRGQTNEFLRPLREAILSVCSDGKIGLMVRSMIDPVLEHMTIRPAEMEPDAFYARLARNPRAWCTALVGYADRCRLLPELCHAILAQTQPEGPAETVATSFLRWDNALCRGGSSNWKYNA